MSLQLLKTEPDLPSKNYKEYCSKTAVHVTINIPLTVLTTFSLLLLTITGHRSHRI